MSNEVIDGKGDASKFDFQRWPVYRLAIEFTKDAYELCRELKSSEARELRDQLRRASQSIVLNIAEGCARFTPADKVNLWRVSKGSAFECVAILDLVTALELSDKDFETQRRNLAEVGRMLSGLIRWILQNPKAVGRS